MVFVSADCACFRGLCTGSADCTRFPGLRPGAEDVLPLQGNAERRIIHYLSGTLYPELLIFEYSVEQPVGECLAVIGDQEPFAVLGIGDVSEFNINNGRYGLVDHPEPS